jgi:hypothetical protein
MGIAEKRQEFADALSTVDGVHGYPYPPNPLREGDAWPVGPVLTREAGTAFMATWRIRVVLPSDERAAAAWFDERWPDLFFAINPVAFVDQAVPVTIAEDQGATVLGIEITARAEE